MPCSELRESLSRVGSDLKHKIVESVKSTWRTINDFALAHRSTTDEAAAMAVAAAANNAELDSSSELLKDEDDTVCKYLVSLTVFNSLTNLLSLLWLSWYIVKSD